MITDVNGLILLVAPRAKCRDGGGWKEIEI